MEKYTHFHIWFDAEQTEEADARVENLNETDNYKAMICFMKTMCGHC